ncbi:Uncharacterized protein TPAR_06824 [Tolypocladium paradoxum]|uniref:Uncharacterized protein n=1 Tax=Tolypocladium paradoxum TaxID=94208 RepID=A0A2S4KS31_9HYPO|nr:Uncharacterized protein TPAR_06824 [Tolypocladium paradoxum]
METSMGPRWAHAGPVKSFHAGGGLGLLKACSRMSATVPACWDDEAKNVGDGRQENVFSQTREAHGEWMWEKGTGPTQGSWRWYKRRGKGLGIEPTRAMVYVQWDR